jgi:predicted CXXCH cytochrome family protein
MVGFAAAMRAFAVAVIGVAWSGCALRTPAPRAAEPSAPARPPVVTSNIARDDYAGSAACAGCHPVEHESWMGAPMHRMTRTPDGADIAAPFDGGAFHFKDDQVRLLSDGGARFVRIESRRFGTRTFRVSKVIGGHHREDFAGVEVAEPRADAPAVGPPGEERVLPVSYMLATGRWRYKGYSVMSPERPGLKRGGVWNKTCMFCHNTVPYLSTILGALAGPGTPPYQGEIVDTLLPPERRAALEVTDGAGLARALRREITTLHGPPPSSDDVTAIAREAVRTTRARFGAAQLLEVGIGCESCHGGSREHVLHSGTRPSFTPRSPFLRVKLPSETRAQSINRVCARCHQVLFTQYPWTWEGAARRGDAPGGSSINSGEARDLLLGGCATQMSCIACHDPHARDDRPRRERLETAEGDRVCLGCHTQLGDEAAQRAHTHHDPARAGGRCMGCHMPKKNMSLDTRLTRYHRIGSPTERARVEGDRPLECALCHAHETVGALVQKMEQWWGKRYDRAALTRLYGGLDVEVMAATLARGKPHEQAVAIAVLGEARARDAAPALVRELVNEVPLVRYYAALALERIVGEASPIDLHRDNGDILRQARDWLAKIGVAVQALPRRPGEGGEEDD